MTLLISDANILIDMQAASLLELMFRLPERFAVPNTLYFEELAEQHGHLPALGLTVLEVEPDFVCLADTLGDRYKKPGRNDLLALALAMQEKCILLTGDRFLREAAEQERMKVRGTLWLVERLHSSHLLTLENMERAYTLMLQGGRRLPKDEIRRQLLRLKAE